LRGDALVVRIGSSERSELCRFDELVASNPEAFEAADEQRLRWGEVLIRAGMQIWRTRDDTCILCGVPIGRGAWRCCGCQHRDRGPGYHVA
jgi:hypothetical protein